MKIKPIRTQGNYQTTLKETSVLMALDPDVNTPEGDRLDVLVTQVQAFEKRNLTMDLADPVEAIKFRVEEQGLQPKDREPMIGQRNRVYEILNRKRPLPLAMIWRVHTGPGIPAESLIRQANQSKQCRRKHHGPRLQE